MFTPILTCERHMDIFLFNYYCHVVLFLMKGLRLFERVRTSWRYCDLIIVVTFCYLMQGFQDKVTHNYLNLCPEW